MPKYLSALSTGEQLEDRVTRNAARELWNASYQYQSYLLNERCSDGHVERLGQKLTDARDEAEAELTAERIELILQSSKDKAIADNSA